MNEKFKIKKTCTQTPSYFKLPFENNFALKAAFEV